MRTTFWQLVRYGMVGLFSNAVGYVLYLLITGVGVEHKLTMTLLYLVGVLQTFFFNRRWTFRHDGTHGPAFVRYCLAYGLGYVLNLAALMILVDVLGYPHQIVQGVMVLVLAALLFVLQKYWVFGGAATRRAEPLSGSAGHQGGRG